MSTMEQLEQRVAAIEERNRRVELDKTWETSVTRRLLILLGTYAILGAYLWVINIPRPWLNAIVPTVGFALSTLVLTPIRKWWEHGRKK